MKYVRKARPSPAMVVALIALFVALSGTAVALNGSNTVQSDDLGPGAQVQAADVAANAVGGPNVVNGSLDLADLNATSRPHKLEFSAAPPTQKVIATFGHLRLQAACQPPSVSGQTALFVLLTNRDSQPGTMNGIFGSQTTGNGPVSWRGIGEFVSEGSGVAYFHNNDPVMPDALARGAFNRVEGQVVFRTPGRVTTIDFHALTTGPSNPRCEFYGTAVTSNLS